ncbi:MAG: hypothetical protein H7A22_15605 [Spirochaetales bacterium]|nr:hypothetical protein [Spirochaetales bacterium]
MNRLATIDGELAKRIMRAQEPQLARVANHVFEWIIADLPTEFASAFAPEARPASIADTMLSAVRDQQEQADATYLDLLDSEAPEAEWRPHFTRARALEALLLTLCRQNGDDVAESVYEACMVRESREDLLQSLRSLLG